MLFRSAMGGAVYVASSAPTARGKMLLFFGALLGVAIVAFASSTLYWVSLPIMVLLGFAAAGRQAIGQVLIQEYAAEQYRGRVAAVWFMQFGLVQFGTFLVGILAHAFGPQLAIGGLAAFLVLAMGISALVSPTVRNLA